MAYESPEKKLERELEELEAAHRQELGLEQPKEKEGAGDEGGEGDHADPSGQREEGQPEGEGKGDQGEGQGDGKESGDRKPENQGGDDPNSESWRQRFLTLQGMFKAEVRKGVEDTTGDLQRQVQEFQQKLEQQEKQGNNGGGDPASADEAVAELVEQYGDKFVESIRKLFGTDIQKTLDERLGKIDERVGNVEATTAKDRFHTQISELAPGWEVTNNDAAFIKWCQRPESEFSEKTVLDVLNEAYQSGDAIRVAKIFNLFNEQSARREPPPKKSAEEHVAPPRRGSADSATIEGNDGKKVWTWAEANKTLTDIENGRISGKEAQEVEAEITKANMEGRIR